MNALCGRRVPALPAIGSMILPDHVLIDETQSVCSTFAQQTRCNANELGRGVDAMTVSRYHRLRASRQVGKLETIEGFLPKIIARRSGIRGLS